MLKAGVDVNKSGQDGETPLWVAVTKWYCDCISGTNQRKKYLKFIKQLILRHADTQKSLEWLEGVKKMAPALEVTDHEMQELVDILKNSNVRGV